MRGREGYAGAVLREGTDCTLIYSPRLGSRQIKGLIRSETSYLDAGAQARDWYARLPFYVVILLALIGTVWAIVNHIRRGIDNLRIVEYQAQARQKSQP